MDIFTQQLPDLTAASTAVALDKAKAFLQRMEKTQRREVLDVYCVLDPNGGRTNVYDYHLNPDAKKLPPLEVEEVAAAGAAAFLQNRLADRVVVAYEQIDVNGGLVNMLVSRAGRVIRYQGRMSIFGGPQDTGMTPTEGLALVNVGNFPNYRDLFKNQQAGTTPLGRNLDPDKFYVACRWDYQNDVAAADFIHCKARVRNPLTGAEEEATPVDWGPNAKLNRVADLSPGLAAARGVKTDDECIVLLSSDKPGVIKPRAPGAPTTIAGSGALKVFSIADLKLKFGDFGAVTENGDGSFRINDPAWENTNIVSADLSALQGVKGIPANGKVSCHRLIKEPLEKAVQALVAAGKKDLILTWDGLWVPRHIVWNPKRAFSTHSWGIAFDINVRWNGFGSPPAPAGREGSVAELVNFFFEQGFVWGGDFRTPDGMHFQFGK